MAMNILALGCTCQGTSHRAWVSISRQGQHRKLRTYQGYDELSNTSFPSDENAGGRLPTYPTGTRSLSSHTRPTVTPFYPPGSPRGLIDPISPQRRFAEPSYPSLPGVCRSKARDDTDYRGVMCGSPIRNRLRSCLHEARYHQGRILHAIVRTSRAHWQHLQQIYLTCYFFSDCATCVQARDKLVSGSWPNCTMIWARRPSSAPKSGVVSLQNDLSSLLR
jgi:hypothetical protein